MGCDIHIIAQNKIPGYYEEGTNIFIPTSYSDNLLGNFRNDGYPFNWRSYGLFGFLANVRNYSKVPFISEARGLPENFKSSGEDLYDDFGAADHSFSWLTVEELATFDYDQEFTDVRSYPPEVTTVREFLGEAFFEDLAELQRVGAYRIVFGFDS